MKSFNEIDEFYTVEYPRNEEWKRVVAFIITLVVLVAIYLTITTV
jgi:hypothetical protein